MPSDRQSDSQPGASYSTSARFCSESRILLLRRKTVSSGTDPGAPSPKSGIRTMVFLLFLPDSSAFRIIQAAGRTGQAPRAAWQSIDPQSCCPACVRSRDPPPPERSLPSTRCIPVSRKRQLRRSGLPPYRKQASPELLFQGSTAARSRKGWEFHTGQDSSCISQYRPEWRAEISRGSWENRIRRCGHPHADRSCGKKPWPTPRAPLHEFHRRQGRHGPPSEQGR